MKRLFHIVWICLAVAACSKDELPGTHGEFASLTLSVVSSQNDVKTRAVSADADEQRINNLYIFIFNPDGSVDYRNYISSLSASSWTGTISGLTCGTGKSVAAIANTDNTVVDITREMLDGIASRAALDSCVVNIRGKFIERGTNFLMTGVAENVTVTADGPVQVTVPLTRVDSKIRFRVTEASGVTFTSDDWRVVSVPRKAGMMASRTDLCTDPAECFDTEWAHFEEDGKTFAFYSLESVLTPRAEIPVTAGTYEEQYALREKQDKTPTGAGIEVANGDYTYAPKTGTCVQLRGDIRYKDASSGVEISADVVYTVHLGGVEGVDDYNLLRNTYYTYNVKIVSVDKIIIEVDSSKGTAEDERRPGAEGDVVMALQIKELDAYNEVFTLSFHQSNVDETMTWDVNTPFSRGAAGEHPADYKWIKFRINSKNSSNFYSSTDFRAYPGDDAVYTGTVSLDTYMTDVANGTDKLLYVDQLVNILQACKERYRTSGSGGSDHLFDSSDYMRFTAFVDEYYYETSPTDPSETAVNGLWKKFVNQQARVMNILSNLAYSPDRQSTKTNAIYSIRQSSIQTMYNIMDEENFTAWGTEMIQEETPVAFEKNTNDVSNPTYNDSNNGRANTLRMWLGGSTTKRWSDYVTTSTWTLKSDYEAAKYKCLRMNRDNDGDGTIDENEVQWYLAAINQLMDLWIGEWSFDQRARLYRKTTWTEGQEQYFASSTVHEKYLGYDNPIILWSSEGSSTGKLSQNYSSSISTPVYYRCVRNLGIPRTAAGTVKPDDMATYDAMTRRISLARIDQQSIRGYFQTAELPEHHEREAANKPWRIFEVLNTPSGGHGYNWESLRSAASAGNSPCPAGYRIPNQRELALMHSRIGNDGNWTLNNHFSRTRFQFDSGRPGFSVSQNNGVLYLLSGTGNYGGVRCVKDINE